LPHAATWWAYLSNLQKAIRRSAVAEALDSAERLYRADPVKLRRRLSVIALEDLNFGDLLTTATALMYAVSAAKEASESDLELCLGLVERVASGRPTGRWVGAPRKIYCDKDGLHLSLHQGWALPSRVRRANSADSLAIAERGYWTLGQRIKPTLCAMGDTARPADRVFGTIAAHWQCINHSTRQQSAATRPGPAARPG
jgi:hypothetical protein